MRYLVLKVDAFGHVRSVNQATIEGFERFIVMSAAASRLAVPPPF
jgi:hypothetical protein